MKAIKKYEVAEIELVYKSACDMKSRPIIRKSEDAYKVLLQSWDLNKIELIEQFKVLFLSRAAKVLAIYNLATGGTSATVIDINLIMTAALKTNAKKLILAHNHPSGTLSPSEADKIITKRVIYAGELLEISVDDHIILTPTDYYSFADNNMM